MGARYAASLRTWPYADFIYGVANYSAPLWVTFATVVYPALHGIVGPDPLFWRGSVGVLASHHTVILFGIFVTWLVMNLRGYSGVVTAFGVTMVVAVHEIIWWVVDYAFGDFPGPPWILLGGWLFPAAVITLIFYVRFVGVPWRFLAFTAGVYVIWAGIGFPITSSWTGPTRFYLDPFVNAVEIVSHYALLAGFYVLEWPRLRTWCKSVERLVKNP